MLAMTAQPTIGVDAGALRPRDDSVLLAGRGGPRFVEVRQALVIAGASVLEHADSPFASVVDRGRVLAWVIEDRQDAERFRDVVAAAPRWRDESLVLIVAPEALPEIERMPWPVSWELLRLPLVPAVTAHVLERLRRVHAGALRAAPAVATEPARMAAPVNPFALDRGPVSADERLHARLQETASGGAVVTWVWDILADTWQATGAQAARGRTIPLAPAQAADLVHVSDRARFRECLREALRDGTRFLTEVRLVFAGGETRWFAIAGNPETGSDGKRVRIVGVGVDVTARKSAELALSELQQQLYDSLFASRMCLWTLDVAADILFVVGPAQAVLGATPSRLQELYTHAHPDDADWVRRALNASAHAGVPLDIEYRVVRAGDEVRWLAVTGSIGESSDGARRLLRGHCIDITQRKGEELLARDLADRLGIALEAAGLSPWIVDLRTGQHFPGPRDVEFFGLPLMSRAMFEERVLPSDLPLVQPLADLTSMTEGSVVSTEYRVRHLDGSVRWLATRAHSTCDARGVPDKLFGVTFDVTARRKAEAALQESRRQLNDALEAGRMLLWRWSAGQGFTIEYGATEHLFGRGSFPTKTFIAKLWPADRARARSAFAHSLKFGLPYSDEYRVHGTDGELRTVHVQGLPYFRSEVDQSRGIWGVLIDVTDRRRIERELQQASTRLYHALNSAGMTIFELPLSALPVDFDTELQRIFGDVAQDDQRALLDTLSAAVSARGSFEHSYRVHEAGGAPGWRQAFGRFEQSPADAEARLSGVLMDVSRQKAAESELQESRRWRDLAVDGAGMSVWEIDIESGTRRGSQLDFSLFGFSPTSTEEFSLLIHPEDRNLSEHAWQTAIDEGTAYSAEMRVRTSAGDSRWIAMHGQPLVDAMSGRRIMVGITMDIDRRRRAEEEQKQALDLARKASEAKSAFLASMSHEIRTPLNAVIGYTGLLADSRLDQQQLSYVGTLRSSAQQLLSLINDILDFSRIEAGELPLDHVPFSMLACVESSIDLVATQAEVKGLSLVAVETRHAARQVVGDVTRVRQIMVNLLNNAVKFTEAGGVTCTLDIVESAHAARITVSVSDSGIGLSDAVRARLFQPFQQGDASTTRRFGGTGLGLSICHRLVALLGGEIRVQSRPGLGSRFDVEFQLPWAQAAEPAPSVALPARVAIAVRSEIMRAAATQQLAAFGIEAAIVAPAEMSRFLGGAEQYDGLVVGERVLDVIDGSPHYPNARDGTPLPLIVLVGIENESGIVRGRHGQRMIRLSRALKPSRFRAALHALRDGIGPGNAGSAYADVPAPPPRATPLRPLRVLIAEDNAVNQALLRLQVEAMGHRVQVVSNGAEAIAATRIDRFDLVLMDVEMPDMDGLDASRAIRAQRDTGDRRLYIAAVTAHATNEMRQRLTASVMDDFIAKPVLREELNAVLTRAIERREQND
jgi:PAS domain S-box-containing protein